jgi:Fe-S-cluster containining protein
VRGGRCVFLENNVCIIHDDRSYPAVCRGFPWIDAEHGGPYEFDQSICPEFLDGTRVVQIQGIGRRAKRQVASR